MALIGVIRTFKLSISKRNTTTPDNARIPGPNLECSGFYGVPVKPLFHGVLMRQKWGILPATRQKGAKPFTAAILITLYSFSGDLYMLLSSSFLNKYPDNPDFGGNGLGHFVYLRTYSRWVPEHQRRETWKETTARVVEYSLSLYRGPATPEQLALEAESMFDAVFNLRVFPAGRSLWVGGTPAVAGRGLANFNCSFLVVDEFPAMVEAFYALMVGAGVGFRVLPRDVEKLPPINPRIVIAHKPYNGKKPGDRIEHTQVYEETGSVYIVVGDSKEGWIDSLARYLDAVQRPDVESIMINYDSIRPAGEVLKTFGGRASGHAALRDMFRSLHKIVCSGSERLRPVQVMDMLNIIGTAVVVGGVRRTSEITLFSPDDREILDAKVDLWTEGSPNYGKFHRGMSNNSIFFERKPTREELQDIFSRILSNGEPGFLNAVAARKRRPNFNGINPCAEILLDSRGTCNLTEVNLMAFVDEDGKIDYTGLRRAVGIATRIGMRLTNVDIELAGWDAVQKRDRLTGVSLTGIMDAVDKAGLDEDALVELLDTLNADANEWARQYAHEMRTPSPLLVTTVKPSGTISQLPTVSSGVHRAFAPYYIRRVRIASTDPLARVMLDLGFPVYPEATYMVPERYAVLPPFEKMDALRNASTWVIEFPVRTAARVRAADESAVQQFRRYLLLQSSWTDHNTSITITFSPDEVPALIDELLSNWDDYVAVSFLPKDTTAYPLMPYEEITEAEYNERRAAIAQVHPDLITGLLTEYENGNLATELTDADCIGGACPVR